MGSYLILFTPGEWRILMKVQGNHIILLNTMFWDCHLIKIIFQNYEERSF